MNNLEKKEIWNLITSRGDFLKGRLKHDPRHPLGRNSYAHICSLIISKFGCSYKEVKSNKVTIDKRTKKHFSGLILCHAQPLCA